MLLSAQIVLGHDRLGILAEREGFVLVLADDTRALDTSAATMHEVGVGVVAGLGRVKAAEH